MYVLNFDYVLQMLLNPNKKNFISNFLHFLVNISNKIVLNKFLGSQANYVST